MNVFVVLSIGILLAGGVTRYASVEQIRVITNNNPTMFNLKKYLDTGDQSLLPEILPGATIFVPKQEEEIKGGLGAEGLDGSRVVINTPTVGRVL